MRVQRIEISISPDGNIEKEELSGFIGDECLAVSKPFEEALGGQIIDRSRKDAQSSDECEYGATEDRHEELLG